MTVNKPSFPLSPLTCINIYTLMSVFEVLELGFVALENGGSKLGTANK